MRGNPHVRFGERIGRNHSEKSLYGALDPTSRDLTPSLADLTVTKQLSICGSFLELPVYDHIILSENGFVSLNDEGYINNIKIKPSAFKFR